MDLSVRGLAQAERLARAFDKERVDAIYTSPSLRALRTAKCLKRRGGVGVEIDDRLQEIDFGVLEGLRFDEVAMRYPDTADLWLRNPQSLRFPGGEDFPTFTSRVLDWLEEARGKPDQCIVAFTHAGVTRRLLAQVAGMATPGMFLIPQVPGCRNLLVEEGTGWRIERVNVAPRQAPIR